MAGEVWRVVPHLPDYEASDLGRVRRRTPGKGVRPGKILKSDGRQAYPTVGTTSGPHRVHVLVAAAFFGPIPVGGEVHHKDEDKRNSRLSNLEVVPSRRAHQERHRRSASTRGNQRHGEENIIVPCACGCGEMFKKFDRWGRPRMFVSGHNYDVDVDGRYAPRRKGGEAVAR